MLTIQWNGYGDSSFIVVSLQGNSCIPTGKQVLNKVYEYWKATILWKKVLV